MERKRKLLQLLADGNFWSGEKLGMVLGLSRGGVWKIIQSLHQLGLDIHSVPGRGYCLPKPIELLSARSIVGTMAETYARMVPEVDVHLFVDSTNNHMLRNAPVLSHGAVCVAEAQSSGRGRRNRKWTSPFATGLYMSLLWRLNSDLFPGLGLVVGLSILRMTRKLGIDNVTLKWPNDVYYKQAKLAGVLLDVSGEIQGGPCSVIIGIGLNFNQPVDRMADVDQPWIDLCTLSAQSLSRNKVCGLMIQELIKSLDEFQSNGFNVFADEWRAHDVCYHKQVLVETPHGIDEGISLGIDEMGALIVSVNGKEKRYLSGDISLRSSPVST